MRKWFVRLIALIVIAGGSYTVYDYYRAGLHKRPAMPVGAFSHSYKNGLRAILVGISNEEKTRRYFGFPFDVPFYLKDEWSFCFSPGEDDRENVVAFMKERDWPGMRFEAICKIEVGDETVVRGVIASVPRL